jgi:signal transduction histidine kinase
MPFAMQYTAFPIVALSVAAMVVSFLIFIYWRRPSSHSGWLLMLGLFSSAWLITNTMEVVAPSPGGTLLWAKISYLFIPLTPLLWIYFAITYLRQNRGNRSNLLSQGWRRLLLLAIIPLITSGMALTNNWHGLLWEEVHYIQVGDMLAMKVDHGPWFFVHVLYSYVMVWGGGFLIALSAAKANRHYQQQSLWLVGGALIPIVVNVFYLLNPFPFIQKDYTPVSFALAIILFGIGVFRHQLFDLAPIARNFVMDSIHDAIFVLDHQGRLADLNQPARQMLGGETEKLGASYAEALAPWPNLLAHVDQQRPFLTWGAPPPSPEQTPPILPLSISGNERMIAVETMPLTTNANDRAGAPVIGGLLILRDFTLYKRTEESLRQRTAELESRNRELDAFAHSVAHDLRNPLSAIAGYSDLLRMECESNPEFLIFVEELQIAAQSMENIIESLLILSQVRHQEIELAPLPMHDVLRRALRNLGQSITDKNATIRLAQSWPTAKGYAPWVSAVWTNYLTNALKYGGDSPKIELGAEEYITQERAGQPQQTWVRFWVKDSGPGLTREEQAKVFQTFTRFHHSAAEGYGLGLSIVARMVERMGGQVGVESEVGQGACFWFALPQINGRIGKEMSTAKATGQPSQQQSEQYTLHEEPIPVST